MADISVVVPAYNAVRYLAATLDSVRAQTVDDWELVVVDDGSTDGTRDLVEDYARRDSRIRLVAQSNAGVAGARNRGVAEASAYAEYVAFLDHDDVWEPDALETLRDALMAHPQAVAAYGLARFIDGEGRTFRPGEAEEWTRDRWGVVDGKAVPWPADAPTTFAVQVYVNRIWTPGQALIRRAALEAAGPMDPDAAPADDYDLWLRLTLRGDLIFVDRVALGFRQHATNESRKGGVMRDADHYVRNKLLALPELSEAQRRLARQAWHLWDRRMVTLRLQWAWGSLRRGQVVQGAKQLRQALRSYLRVVGSLGRWVIG